MTAKLKHRRGLALWLLAGILTPAAGPLTARAEPAGWQAPASIAAAARAAAEANGSGAVEALAVDERLKLAECGAPLEARVERPVQRGQGTIAVSCSGPKPWRLFVPVRSAQLVPVLVLARNAQAGETLRAADLVLEQRRAAALPYDYMSDADDVVGFTLKRTQAAGAVLVPGALERPEVIARGSLVTVIAGDGPVSVKSDGVALDAAHVGQRVRVRSASGRIVEGTATGPSQVRVGS